jgi:hypothetical protein
VGDRRKTVFDQWVERMVFDVTIWMLRTKVCKVGVASGRRMGAKRLC